MLTLNQYREINSLTDSGVFEKMIHTVSVILGLDEYDVQNWDSDKLVREYNRVEKFTVVSERYSNEIQIEGLNLSIIPFESLTLGQWIDVESLVSSDYIGNLHEIAASVYLSNKGGGLYSDEWEQYGNINIKNRAQLIDELPAQQTIGACVKYLRFRKNLFNSYELFNDPLEDVNPEELDPEELEIFNEEKAEREKVASNQWERLLNLLSNNDITKFDSVLSQNLFLSLNQASYLKTLKS